MITRRCFRSICSLAATALIATVAIAQESKGFALHSGDRVVFYGDSITDNSAYCKDVETYVLTRFPGLDVRFYNAGVGGDRVSGGWMGPVDQRLTRDLFSRRPTVVTSMLAMNDASYRTFDQTIFETYARGYEHIVDRLHKEAPDARVWLFRPSPFDDVTRKPGWEGGYNGVLLKYADYVSDLAKKNNYGVVDENGPLVDFLHDAEAANPKLAPQVIADRVHPGWQGDYLMAEQVIKAWGGPSLVADLSIDVSGGMAARNTRITGLKASPTGVSWTELDGSLPFPVNRADPLAAFVLQVSDFDKAINQESLTVKGLQAGTYQLLIDKKKVGAFTSDQFQAGINLATLDTPMVEQAAEVADLTNKKCDIFYQRWRQLDFGLKDRPSAALEGARRANDRLIEELVGEQHKAAKPKPHLVEITP